MVNEVVLSGVIDVVPKKRAKNDDANSKFQCCYGTRKIGRFYCFDRQTIGRASYDCFYWRLGVLISMFRLMIVSVDFQEARLVSWNLP